jgi:ribulose-5-phosphate 4-epimerase/fuculose-1-phosphate aldolase
MQGFDEALGLREQIAFGCRVLHRLGVAPSHISARLPNSAYVVVKTRGGSPGGTTRDQVCVVNMDGKLVAGEGEPPAELPLHLEIYRVRADVDAIGHTHQPSATALIGTPDAARSDVPTYPYSDQIRTTEQGSALARALGAAAMVHLRDHGMAITGASVDEVVARAVELETWARDLATKGNA